jgi:FlaA1/EpsC-like NDP-sugar epimerase
VYREPGLLKPDEVAGIVLNRPVSKGGTFPDGFRKRRFLITGAAGSIGSRLCRKLADCEPAALVALDRSENGVFRLRSQDIDAVPGDVCDEPLIAEIIERRSIDTVIHAAAYKHVPLMEGHPIEAIRNNVLGTYTVTRAAARRGVHTLLLVSTDKAANPKGVMGKTKRAAEKIVSAMFVKNSASIRLGNVLGSEGSMWTTFLDQISSGVPVTITHPDAARYFLTFDEAVDFILRAVALANAGGILVPRMGEPVRVLDIAHRMAGLLGHNGSMKTRTIGLRPGDKLLEDLKDDSTEFESTCDPGMDRIGRDDVCPEEVTRWMAELQEAVTRRDLAAALNLLPAGRADRTSAP